MSNALLAKTNHYLANTTDSHGNPARMAIDEGMSGFCTTPTAHVRDLAAAGIKPAGLAVYFAIADRMMTSKGSYFRSNSRLAEETGLSVRTVSRQIAEIKKAGYLTVFYVNKQRRLRALATPPVARGVDTSGVTPRHQCLPDKENSIKKTQQHVVVVSLESLDLSKEERALFGEKAVEKLLAAYGPDAILRGLDVYRSAKNKKNIDNPVGFLTNAIKQNWQPTSHPTSQRKKFTDCPIEHEKIINRWLADHPDRADEIQTMREKYLGDGWIACKITKEKK